MWSAPFQQLANTGVNHPHWALTCADIRMFSLAAHFFAHRWQLRFRIRILLESVWYVTVTTMTHDHIMMISFFFCRSKMTVMCTGSPLTLRQCCTFLLFLMDNGNPMTAWMMDRQRKNLVRCQWRTQSSWAAHSNRKKVRWQITQ
jgi:hypothetical protein